MIETDRDTEALADDDGEADAANPEDLGIEVNDCAQAMSAVGQTYASLSSPGEMDGGIAELEGLVPDEFQSDVDVVSDAVDEMQAAFDSAGAESGDPDATRAVVEENRDALDAAEDAMANIEEHFRASCESLGRLGFTGTACHPVLDPRERRCDAIVKEHPGGEQDQAWDDHLEAVAR